MPDTQSQHLGKYEILAEIGKGGFATVYRALDATLGREVALKVLDPLLMRDPTWVARFRNEARTIAALDHPRIVPIYEIGQAEGVLFIAMKLLENGSLADRIATGPLPWTEIVRLTSEIAQGLDFAHSRKVLHRDLKPANVLLDVDGHAVLTDFGFARLVADHSLSVSISGGGMVGTPAYIAPEVWEGEPPGRPADLYALGCIVYEMAVGVQPFTGSTTPAVMRAHFKPLALPDRWPAGTPAGLGDVLAVALAQAPGDRYTQAGELAAAVAGLMIDALAEPYAALQAAVAAGDWTQARALASRIRAQKPDYRDVVALEAKALAGLEHAARVEQAAAWRTAAEAALAEGDRSGATLAAKQWTALTPNDPALAELQAQLREPALPPIASAGPTPKLARPFRFWLTASVGAAVLLVTVVLLSQVLRRNGEGGSPSMAPSIATVAFVAAAPTATTPSPTRTHTPTPINTSTLLPTHTQTPSPTASPMLTATHTRTPTVAPTMSRTLAATKVAIATRVAASPTPKAATQLSAVHLGQPDGSNENGQTIHFSWTGRALSATQGYALLVWPDNGTWNNRTGLDLPAVADFCQAKFVASEFDLSSAILNNAPWIGPGRYYWTVVIVDTARKDASGRCALASPQAAPRSFSYDTTSSSTGGPNPPPAGRPTPTDAAP